MADNFINSADGNDFFSCSSECTTFLVSLMVSHAPDTVKRIPGFFAGNPWKVPAFGAEEIHRALCRAETADFTPYQREKFSEFISLLERCDGFEVHD